MQWLIHRNKHNKHLHVSAVPLSYFHGSIGASCPSFTTLSLLNVKDSVTTRARVVRILKLIHEEGDQAAAQHQPAENTQLFKSRTTPTHIYRQHSFHDYCKTIQLNKCTIY